MVAVRMRHTDMTVLGWHLQSTSIENKHLLHQLGRLGFGFHLANAPQRSASALHGIVVFQFRTSATEASNSVLLFAVYL